MPDTGTLHPDSLLPAFAAAMRCAWTSDAAGNSESSTWSPRDNAGADAMTFADTPRAATL